MAEFEYTAGQIQAANKLEAFIASRTPGIFRLSGSAGTGKTTLSEKVPGMVRYGRVIGTAPTHKAVKVLSTRLDAECMTIHSFLGLKPSRGKDGEEKLNRRGNYDPTQFMDVTVVCVDEASMVDHNLLEYIQKDILEYDRQYIMLGDNYQLPPPGCRWPPVFELDLPPEQAAELTEIVRHSGPIIKAATAVRDAIVSGVEPAIKFGDDGNSKVVEVRRKEVPELLTELTSHEQFLRNPDFCRVVAWRNEQVWKHSAYIRKLLKGNPSVPFEVGDFVVANEPFLQYDQVVFNTGSEFTVTGMWPAEHPIYPQLKGWLVEVTGYDNDIPIFVLDPINCKKAYDAVLAKLSDEAKANRDWQPYFALKDYYADLRPVYSLTIHKSQGSTFVNTVVDYNDIVGNRIKSEADRCLYVAITRSSQATYVVF